MRRRKAKPATGAGARREAFMGSGQSLALWRGRPVRHTDKRKAASRKACRRGQW